MKNITSEQIINTLIATGYILAGIILLWAAYQILVWVFRGFRKGWLTPLFGHRAYFYRYMRGPVFYSESFLRFLFIKFRRNKKWAIHSGLVGFVKRPFFGSNDKDKPAEIFTTSFGQKEPVAFARFVHDENNVKKADIVMGQYDATGNVQYDEANPVGYVDVNGDIYKYYQDYSHYKNRLKLVEACKIGSCSDILGKEDKIFSTGGEERDEDTLPYIVEKEGEPQNDSLTDDILPEDQRLKDNALPSSWLSFRINKPGEKEVTSTRFDSTSRRGIGRCINVVPLNWDVKAMAYGYGYSCKNPNWGKPSNLHEIPLINIGCAALLLLEQQGFLRYEDEAIEEPGLHWAETAMLSLFIYMASYFTLLKFSLLKIIFPFIGPQLSLTVMMVLLFFGIWGLTHFIYSTVLGRPWDFKRVLDMLNANVGTLRYTRTTITITLISLVLTIIKSPSTLFPLFLAILVVILINRKFYPQRRWKVIDPFDEDNDAGDGFEDTSETSDLVKKEYKWTFQNSFKNVNLSMDLYFNSEIISGLRNLNPFRESLKANYTETARKMILDELGGNVDSKLDNKLKPELAHIKFLFNKLARDKKMTQLEKLNMILVFCQQAIEYKVDDESEPLLGSGIKGEYCRFSRETLFDLEGDCDCKSELAATLLADAGCRVAYVVTNDHAFIGLSTKGLEDLKEFLNDAFFMINGEEFLYCEPTGDNWLIGSRPPTFKFNEIESGTIIDKALIC